MYIKMKDNCPILKRTDLFRAGEKFFIHNSKDLPEFVSKTHCHDFVEISYVISGKCRHIENNVVRNFQKSDLYVINYMMPHSDQILGDEPFFTYDIAFAPEFIDIALHEVNDFLSVQSSFLFSTLSLSGSDFKPFVSLRDNHFDEMETLLKKMLNEYTHQTKGYSDMLRVYLVELLILIFRKIDNAADLPTKEASMNSYIEYALRYIHDHHAERITLADIAYRSFVSKSYFSTLFKNETGMSFSNYLQKLRIDTACELLKTTGLPVQSIVEKTGFCDYKFFYDTFKKIKNMTPGEFRSQHKTK